MIIDLPSTTSSKINRALVDLRDQGGSVALSRVLTLVIVTEDGQAEDPIEKHWARAGGPLEQYEPGTWGPPSADAMMARDGRRWRRP